MFQQPPKLIYRIGLALSLLTGLLVIAVATTLNAFESRVDRVTLTTVGASPWLSRSHAAAQAGFLAFLGCVLAVPAGLVPAFGLLTSMNSQPLIIPWKEIALTTAALPALAYVGAWIFTRPPNWNLRWLPQ